MPGSIWAKREVFSTCTYTIAFTWNSFLRPPEGEEYGRTNNGSNNNVCNWQCVPVREAGGGTDEEEVPLQLELKFNNKLEIK